MSTRHMAYRFIVSVPTRIVAVLTAFFLVCLLTLSPSWAQIDPAYFVGAISKYVVTSLGSAPTVTTVPAAGATPTVAFATYGSSAYDLTLTANATFAITTPTAPTGVRQSIFLKIRNPTGGFTIAFPGSVKWHNGTAPTFVTTAGTIIEVEINTTDAGATYTAR